jgi:hypothetical protein
MKIAGLFSVEYREVFRDSIGTEFNQLLEHLIRYTSHGQRLSFSERLKVECE